MAINNATFGSDNYRVIQRPINLYSKSKPTISLIQQNSTIFVFEIIGLNGEPFTIEDVILNAVRRDNTLIVQETGIAIDGNVLTIILDPRIVDISGRVMFELVFLDGDIMISTYKFDATVDSMLVNGQSTAPPASEIMDKLYISTRAPEIDRATGRWKLYDNVSGEMVLTDFPSYGDGSVIFDIDETLDINSGNAIANKTVTAKFNDVDDRVTTLEQSGGGGANGLTPELMVVGNYIVWRYLGDTAWTNLIALSALKGADGAAGADGRNISLQVANGYIQWQLNGDSAWNDLISLDNLKGADGTDGVGLDYNWSGTSLGIKRADESTYTYVDLKGEPGSGGSGGDVDYKKVANALIGNSAPAPIVTIDDMSPYDTSLRGLTIYGNTTQEGEPAPNNPIPLIIVSSTTITIGDTPQSHTLNGITLASSNDAHDTIEIKDGKVISTKRIGKVTYNGSESGWLYFAGTGVKQCYISKSDVKHAAAKKTTLSNYYKPWYTNGRANNYGTVYTYTTGIAFNDERFANINDWKSWLSTNNVTVMYQLATPIVTDITATADGQALLAMFPEDYTVIEASGGALVGVEYNRDINAFAAEVYDILATLLGG